jgi:hypothetical protein
MSSALAVFMLIVSANLVARWAGRSAGLSPRTGTSGVTVSPDAPNARAAPPPMTQTGCPAKKWLQKDDGTLETLGDGRRANRVEPAGERDIGDLPLYGLHRHLGIQWQWPAPWLGRGLGAVSTRF